jgi:hypothetical protein
VPAAYDLAAAGCLQAGIVQGGFEVAWPREGIGCVIARPFGWNERGHGLVRDRALGPFGRREQAGHHTATWPGDAGRLAQGPPRVARELEGVDAGHRVEGGVAERQRLHVGFAQVGAREPVTGDGEQAGADVDAAGYRAAFCGQREGQPGAAAHVEDGRSRTDGGSVEDGFEQRAVVRLGQFGPGQGVGAPQAALDLGRGADHVA